MKTQVLLSTMRNNKTILDKMNISSNCVVVNQDSNLNNQIELEKNILWINTSDKGLSKSRNIAISNSSLPISIIADDDLVYVENYQNIISNAFDENPNVDILIFIVEGKNKKFKNYRNNEYRIGYFESLKVSSVQITFRTNSVKNVIRFNESFGAGAEFCMGEENIFLFDALRKGLKIKFIPIKIADLYIGDSSWFDGYNQKYLIDRGASFYAMSKPLHIILILQFAVRKKRLFKSSNIGVIQSIELMMRGKNKYKNLKK